MKVFFVVLYVDGDYTVPTLLRMNVHERNRVTRDRKDRRRNIRCLERAVGGRVLFLMHVIPFTVKWSENLLPKF